MDEYALSNGKTEVKIITLGGTITEVNLGSGSKAANVTLAFASLEDYETKNGGPRLRRLTPARTSARSSGGSATGSPEESSR